MAKSGYNTYKGVLVKWLILNELRKNEERVTFFVRDPLCGWAMGIEPTTTGTTIRGSTTELHPPSWLVAVCTAAAIIHAVFRNARQI